MSEIPWSEISWRERRGSAALAHGWERMSAWSDLLDDINVFPVADGDTGRNLAVSLLPLHRCEWKNADFPGRIMREIHRGAVGNSGNIAACYFSGFLGSDTPLCFSRSALAGRDAAWAAVGKPEAGTMLSVFDALAAAPPVTADDVPKLIEALADAVRSGPDLLPELAAAGVADAGAVGMFIFLEGFFSVYFNMDTPLISINDRFGALLGRPREFNGRRIHKRCVAQRCVKRCVQAVIRPRPDPGGGLDNCGDILRTISHYGKSTVVSRSKEEIRVHFHTDNDLQVRDRVKLSGDVLEWSAVPMDELEIRKAASPPLIHIMTDAAGSIQPATARKWGITVLSSYVILGDRAIPETLVEPADLYAAMQAGVRVSTAQSSNFERHERYAGALGRFNRVLYLCVGSAYTGNFEAACRWKALHDPDERLTIIDTGAAAGRLGAAVLATAQFAARGASPESVIAYAHQALKACGEYIFPDRLCYLARGGRISRTQAFVGDRLHMRPVITPTPAGVKRVGMTGGRKAQLAYAVARLERLLDHDGRHLILLQYSDNFLWVKEYAARVIEKRFRFSDIRLQPLSLTSGTHLGPGTWAVAFMPATAG